MTMSSESRGRDMTRDSPRPLSDDRSDIQKALDKLGRQPAFASLQAEPVTPAAIFDIAALILFGCQAIPIRLKILLDRLFAKLSEDDVAQILRAFGWSREEYMQGYIKNAEWTKCSSEEEPLILQQFLRFEETRQIAVEFLQKDEKDGKKMPMESDIKKLVERVQPFIRPDLLQRSTLGFPGMRLPAPPFPAVTSPNGAYGAPPPAATTASAVSPLNRLQSMQPFERRSPDGSLDLSKPAVSSAVAAPPPAPPAASLPPAPALPAALPLTSSAMNLTLAKPPPDNPQLALNLTASAMELEKRAKKPLTPVKRRSQWDPIGPNPTALVNPVTGKKRVQCHACLKTFCDKGALKIHFSAVHLKEMHKCSVEGCTMMFSSRRSRNRHSANPNPKLHTPHMRRKISPHDGRMAQPHPPVSLPPTLTPNFPHPGLLGSFNPLTGFPLLPNPELQKQALESLHNSLNTLDLTYQRSQGGPGFMLPGGGLPESLMNRRLEQYQEELRRRGHLDGQRDDKRYRSDSNDEQSSVSGVNNDDDGVSVENQSLNGEAGSTGADEPQHKRKRKSQNPIKFSVRLDEDDIHMSSDDSSLDDLPDDEDDKDDDEDDEELKNLKSDDDDSGDEKESEGESKDAKSSVPSYTSQTQEPEDQPKNVQGNGAVPSDRPASSAGIREEDEPSEAADQLEATDQNQQDQQPDGEQEEIAEHLNEEQQHSFDSLKRLESLSKGNFGDFLAKGLMGQPGQAPPSLPMGLNHVNLMREDSGAENNDSGREDDEISNADSSFSISPSSSPNHLGDGCFGNGDIPIDKENPRRCVVCGKMFQNHFGVKTHYQNVHLKVMHKCTVEGCKAKFPSKRSRDRHSSNYNLHRKLLSTSSDQPAGRPEAPFPGFPAAWSSEYLSRLCSDPSLFPLGLPAGLPEGGPVLPPHPMFLMHPALAANYQASLAKAERGAGGGQSRSPSPKVGSPPAIKENNNEALAKVS